MDLEKLYDENDDFRRYVDRYRKLHSEGQSISLAEALQHEVVRQYGIACVEQAERK